MGLTSCWKPRSVNILKISWLGFFWKQMKSPTIIVCPLHTSSAIGFSLWPFPSHQYKCEDLLPQTALRMCVQEPWLYWCIYYNLKFIHLLPLLLLPFLLLLRPPNPSSPLLLHLLLTVLLLQLLLLLPLIIPFLLLLPLLLLPLLVLPLLLLFLHLLLLLVI